MDKKAVYFDLGQSFLLKVLVDLDTSTISTQQIKSGLEQISLIFREDFGNSVDCYNSGSGGVKRDQIGNRNLRFQKEA